MRRILIFLLFIDHLSCLGQQPDISKYISSITGGELRQHVTTLASDTYEGRETGQPGQKLAAAYIKDVFGEYSFSGNIDGSIDHLQKFTVNEVRLDSFYIETSNARLEFGDDFRTNSMKDPFMGEICSDLVFMGYGMDDDYSGRDVTGKVVIYFEGKPSKSDQASDKQNLPAGVFVFDEEKFDVATRHGAIAAICIGKDFKLQKMITEMLKPIMESRMSFEMTNQEEGPRPFSSEIMLDHASAADLLGISEEELTGIRDKSGEGSPPVEIEEAAVRIKASRSFNEVPTENVFAYCEGTDPDKGLVVVVAHYDHLGKSGDKIYMGADDNASGVAALLEIAGVVDLAAREGNRPARSILFLAVTGEEKGLLGSQYYVDNPIFPVGNTTLAINMDMLGRSDVKHGDSGDYVYVYSNESEDSYLHEICIRAGENVKNSLHPEYRFRGKSLLQGGSDHQSFEKAGIPVLYYFKGTHIDYHKPTDTADKIDYGTLKDISQLVLSTLWEVANN
ncbi:MAG: M28 family peptidase [Bacteroidales bacterium]|nr:M28 family peptidase [Bacteroidales bacterium]